MRMVDEALVKKVLSNYEKLKIEVKHKLKIFYEELADEDDSLLSEVAYKKINYDKIGGSSNNINDLSSVIENHQRLVRERGKEVRKIMSELMKQQEMYHRIWSCFNLLDTDAYETLTRLYRNNELYVTVESDSGLSHRSFEKRRKQAIEDIIRLYHGELTNDEIMRIKLNIVEPTVENNFVQISFDI